MTNLRHLAFAAILITTVALFMYCFGLDDQTKSENSDAGTFTTDPEEIWKTAFQKHGCEMAFYLPSIFLEVEDRGYRDGELEDKVERVVHFLAPDQFRESNVYIQPATTTILYIRNGNEAWKSINNEPFQGTAELRSLNETPPFILLSQLRHLKSTEFPKTYKDDVNINEKQCAAINVEIQGNTVESFFDRQTGLLAKIKTTAMNPITGKMATSEAYYSDYESIAGVMIPHEMEQYFDGVIFAAYSIRTVELPPAVDPELFRPNE